MREIVLIAVISLYLVSFVFGFIAVFFYGVSCITGKNSVSTYGTLVGFRKYYHSNDPGDNFVDCDENTRGSLPVFTFKIAGKGTVQAAAVVTNNQLNSADIGKQVAIRYSNTGIRRITGINVIVDDAQSFRNYSQLQNTLFGVFISISIILLIFGIVANVYLSKLI